MTDFHDEYRKALHLMADLAIEHDEPESKELVTLDLQLVLTYYKLGYTLDKVIEKYPYLSYLQN